MIGWLHNQKARSRLCTFLSQDGLSENLVLEMEV
uniref:Uncharacterized protein n=1 Tax=Rhizophora mucronata TaxID=61149 RepID=A0A2P2PXZ5_RHIMU